MSQMQGGASYAVRFLALLGTGSADGHFSA